jgi:hypothetical protein
MKVGRPYAVFVLGRRATSAGDGTCAAATRCRIVGLRPGDTRTVTVHALDGRSLRRYVLRVASVTRVATTAARARALRAQVDPRGRAALRAMSRSSVVAEALDRVGYRAGTGLLYSVAAATPEKSAR